MDRLDAMSVFVKVVETGGFSQAADALGFGRPAITRAIQHLESYLNTQLFQRSTRQVSVTAEGERYYHRCLTLLGEISELEGSFSLRQEDTKGSLRIALPAYVAKHFIVPRLDEFKSQYPNINLSLSVADTKNDISFSGADCIVKAGPLPDSDLVARPLVQLPMVTVASNAFLGRHGLPIKPIELQSFPGIRHQISATRYCEMEFETLGQFMRVRLANHVAVDDMETAVACAAAGLGIVQCFRFLVQPYIASGLLLEILADDRPAPQPLFVLYPKMSHRSRALQTFVDWIFQIFDVAPSIQTIGMGVGGSAPTKIGSTRKIAVSKMEPMTCL